MSEQKTDVACIACSSPAVARVQDGVFRKPVCSAHRRIYANRGYLIDALSGPPIRSASEVRDV